MVPGEYTALFFLDEAVSLAAGHRPCRECRRAAFEEFVAAWRKANGIATDMKVGANEIDAALHASRVAPGRKQARFFSELGALPDGAMFAYPAEPRDAWLFWKGAAHRWSHAGYVERRALHSILVDVITPLRTVETLRAGYRPTVHASASTN